MTKVYEVRLTLDDPAEALLQDLNAEAFEWADDRETHLEHVVGTNQMLISMYTRVLGWATLVLEMWCERLKKADLNPEWAITLTCMEV